MSNEEGNNIINMLEQQQQEDVRRSNRLFRSSETKVQASKDEPAQASISLTGEIEAKKTTSTNIFIPKTHNIFSSDKGVNLFKLPPSVTNVNIFDITAKPIVAPSEVDNDESDENEQAIISQQKNFKSEPDVKEMKYEYISEYERLGEFKLRKFREGTKVPKDMVYVTIERHRTHSALVYLFIRTNDTKLVVFHSLLMKNVSKMEHFNGKDYNLKLNVVINKLKQKESQEGISDVLTAAIEQIKMQFENGEQSARFKDLVENTLQISPGVTGQEQHNQSSEKAQQEAKLREASQSKSNGETKQH